MTDIYEKSDPFQFKTNPGDSIRRDKIIEALGGRRFKRALDIGCAEGFVSQYLPADEIYGNDISLLAMSRLPENVKAVKKEDISGEYDLIVATACLYKEYDAPAIVRIINEHASGTVLICVRVDAEDVEAVAGIKGKIESTKQFPYHNTDGEFTQKMTIYSVSDTPVAYITEETYVFHNIGARKHLSYHTVEQVDKCKGLLTFDGVYLSVYENREFLKDRNVILYFIGDYLGKDNSFDKTMPLEQFCDMSQLREMEAMGCILGWHTNSHVDLRKLADEDLKKEVTPPFPMDYFCYPYGEFDKRVISAVKKAGFKYAHALWENGNNTDYQLKRKMV